ncbi:hypothetical protein M408DRAFT_331689 [Serendipita vermifera MAFF 305830]|uniref:Serine aminopeptidase S33 domain-containing protein n=1 Tax=Serendipita vermifera MAFF 305830 TaxID=933852 RepID=A0A0C3AXM0_SERVB|nr:hypothetical protein M408DRAFT_331689 [Serendipita vermifera MAFF 305830]
MPSTKISILQKRDPDPNCALVGILEQPNGAGAATPKPLALILHGAMGHKDYLFQRKLALRLPMDSFRFDFRGNHESGGAWTVGGIDRDVDDIQVVAEYLKQTYDYNVVVVIGHSRGSIAGCKWVCCGSKETLTVQKFVNVSGRYLMGKFRGIMHRYEDEFREKGYGEWHVRVAGKPVIGKIYPKDVESFASWDISYIASSFPDPVNVLTVQGMADAIVPPHDAILYAQAFGNPKRSGRHTLHYVEGADHNYSGPGHHEDVIVTIVEWLQSCEEGSQPVTYLWHGKSHL